MSANGKMRHVYSRDPALARTLLVDGHEVDNSAAVAAAVEAFNAGKPVELPLRDGRQPVIWELVSLSERGYAELARVSNHEILKAFNSRDPTTLAAHGLYSEQREAFRRGAVNVQGVVDANGRPLELKTEEAGGGQRVLTQATMEIVFARFKAGPVAEIGQRIIDACDLDPTSGQD